MLRFMILIKKFQSTHPIRSATFDFTKEGKAVVFQSTHSIRSATVPFETIVKGHKFQSTHSIRSATLLGLLGLCPVY
ncbi:MAG: hypothetical protein K0Q90_2416 [Paenibacillaceae bacterium]|nr:hypothetical protein [Paenibacillaceae bacterium]